MSKPLAIILSLLAASAAIAQLVHLKEHLPPTNAVSDDLLLDPRSMTYVSSAEILMRKFATVTGLACFCETNEVTNWTTIGTFTKPDGSHCDVMEGRRVTNTVAVVLWRYTKRELLLESSPGEVVGEVKTNWVRVVWTNNYVWPLATFPSNWHGYYLNGTVLETNGVDLFNRRIPNASQLPRTAW